MAEASAGEQTGNRPAIIGEIAETDAELVTNKKIAELEGKIKQSPDRFLWGVHNELRHLYAGKQDSTKSRYHSDQILRNSIMDGYIVGIFGARVADPNAAMQELFQNAEKEENAFPLISLACLLKAAEIQITQRDMLAADATIEKARAVLATLPDESYKAAYTSEFEKLLGKKREVESEVSAGDPAITQEQ